MKAHAAALGVPVEATSARTEKPEAPPAASSANKENEPTYKESNLAIINILHPPRPKENKQRTGTVANYKDLRGSVTAEPDNAVGARPGAGDDKEPYKNQLPVLHEDVAAPPAGGSAVADSIPVGEPAPATIEVK